MGDTLRQCKAEDTFRQALTLEALSRAVPLADSKAVLLQEGVPVQRERTRNMVGTMFVVLAMHLSTPLAMGHVMRQLAHGRRFVWPDPPSAVPHARARTDRRYPLGGRPLAA